MRLLNLSGKLETLVREKTLKRLKRKHNKLINMEMFNKLRRSNSTISSRSGSAHIKTITIFHKQCNNISLINNAISRNKFIRKFISKLVFICAASPSGKKNSLMVYLIFSLIKLGQY